MLALGDFTITVTNDQCQFRPNIKKTKILINWFLIFAINRMRNNILEYSPSTDLKTEQTDAAANEAAINED